MGGGSMEIKVYNGDPENIWAIVNTRGQEITELALSRTADKLFDLAVAENPDDDSLQEDFWAITWKPIDSTRIMIMLRPDTRTGRISSHVEKFHPTPPAPRTMTFEQARAACTL